MQPLSKLFFLKRFFFSANTKMLFEQPFSFRSSYQRCCIKKTFLEISQNSQENTCARVPFSIKNFNKKETLKQVFFREFCEISKNTFFKEHLWATASVFFRISNIIIKIKTETITWKQHVFLQHYHFPMNFLVS